MAKRSLLALRRVGLELPLQSLKMTGNWSTKMVLFAERLEDSHGSRLMRARRSLPTREHGQRQEKQARVRVAVSCCG